jgi:phosphoglycerate dehydrogenase-like enzyme
MTEKLHLHIKNNRDGELVFRNSPAQYRKAAKRNPAVADQLKVTFSWDFDDLDKYLATANALVTWELPTENLAERAPNLKNIHIIGAGVEHLSPINWLPRHTTMTNNRGVHAAKAEDYAGMALSMLNNNIPKYVSDQKAKIWSPTFARPIVGKTVLIVGVGEMGGAVAKAAKRLGLHVLGIRRHGKQARNVDEMFKPSALRQQLRRADYLVVTTPLTDETRGMIGRREMGLMKKSAGIVNMSRAPVIDEIALADKLGAGELAGAILDVTDPEPLNKSSKLWSVVNLIITPHVSADDDVDYVPATLDLVLDNMDRLLMGKSLRNKVNPKLGY